MEVAVLPVGSGQLAVVKIKPVTARVRNDPAAVSVLELKLAVAVGSCSLYLGPSLRGTKQSR